jgi:hypothetical protein
MVERREAIRSSIDRTQACGNLLIAPVGYILLLIDTKSPKAWAVATGQSTFIGPDSQRFRYLWLRDGYR